MEQIYNTPQAAKLLGVKPSVLQRAVWDGKIHRPEKSPSGNYVWKVADLERASWVLRRRSLMPEVKCDAVS